MSVNIDSAKLHFEKQFNRNPEITARAPGRVNIIGEHTDYNHGFVLPMAIERDTVIVGAPRDDSTLNVISANFDQDASVDLKNLTRSEPFPWLDYISGVASMLQESGKSLPGADLLILGDVPLGSGLSSSASLEMAAVSMFETLAGFTLDDIEAAKLCQGVENDFLGVSSGIMDPLVSRCAHKDHALFLDCRSLEAKLIPAKFDDAVFIIADTKKPRTLAESEYNDRVDQCASAVIQLNKALTTGKTHLRDFTEEQLHEAEKAMSDVEFYRAKHVITENNRTLQACEALQNADLPLLGDLMKASNASLDIDYEVSCAELRAMTRIARSLEGCYGTRMTGAGFGGCTLSLVNRDHASAFSVVLKQRYDDETGLDSEIIINSEEH